MDSDENRLAARLREDFSAGHVALSVTARAWLSHRTANVDKSGHVRVFETRRVRVYHDGDKWVPTSMERQLVLNLESIQ